MAGIILFIFFSESGFKKMMSKLYTPAILVTLYQFPTCFKFNHTI
jgi:hypothetical protein